VTRRVGLVGSLRPVEQTPEGTFVIEALHRAFPEARVIHMLRDGRDVAASLLERGWLSAGTVAEDAVGPLGASPRYWVEPKRASEFATVSDARRAGWAWRRYVTAARRAGERAFEIRYERLVESPRRVAADLGEFLDIPAEFLVAPLEQAHGGSIGRYRRDLRTSDLAEINQEAGPLLSELGYA